MIDPMRLLAAFFAAVIIAPVPGIAAPGSAADLSAQTILSRALAAEGLGLGIGRATLAMTIKDRDGYLLRRQLVARSRRDDEGRATRLTFTAPPEQKGVELLMIQPVAGEARHYLYLPQSKAVRRIEGGAKGGRFMGSDLTFDDLEGRDRKRGRAKRLPDTHYAKRPVYRVDVLRDDQAADMVYGRVSFWIDKESWLPLKVVFFRHGDAPAKRLQVKGLAPVEGKLAVARFKIADLEQGSETTIAVKERAPQEVLPRAMFRKDALGQ